MTVVERILARLEVSPGGCLLWQGSRNNQGYGVVSFQSKNRLVHRLAYEAFIGPIPEGLELDHLCRTKVCANPAHLEPVTHAENSRRAAALITHCPQGHAYDEENTRRESSGQRRCRICRKEKDRIYYLRHRDAVKARVREYKTRLRAAA